MKNFETAFGQIRRRSMTQVRESVGVETPFAFEAATDTSETADFIEANWEQMEGEHATVLTLPGRDMNLARDTLIASAKFFHVIGSVRSQIARGATTWAIVDAYHAALIGTRLIAALYGVLSYNVKGRTVLVDFRPELGSPDDRKAFKKDFKLTEEPIRILRPNSKQLSQSDAWGLVGRLCNITPVSTDIENILASMKAVAADKVSSFRNGILYDSVAWTWLDDFGATPATVELQRDRISASEERQSLTIDALTQIFAFTQLPFISFCNAVGVDPLSISPLTEREPSPVHLLV